MKWNVPEVRCIVLLVLEQTFLLLADTVQSAVVINNNNDWNVLLKAGLN